MNPFDELEVLSKGELITGGRASGKPESKYDPKDVARGKKIEMEHVEGGSYPQDVQERVAEEISRDHLEEHPEYYDEDEGLPGMEHKLSKLGKAGTGEGAFRGGDPELAQMKQQEKKQAQEDLGDVGEEEEPEEPDESAIQDQIDKDEAKQDKLASLGKSWPAFVDSSVAQEVSPVNTDEDYNDDKDPKRDVANYYNQFRGEQRPFVEPCPLDRREHQGEVWSEALGYKIPLEGNPAFYLRRFAMVGDKEGYQRAMKQVFKSLDELLEKAEPAEEEDGLPGVQMLLEHINELDKDQLVQIAKRIWGDDYEYEEWMDDDYIRNDVQGSLMDIMESGKENFSEDQATIEE